MSTRFGEGKLYLYEKGGGAMKNLAEEQGNGRSMYTVLARTFPKLVCQILHGPPDCGENGFWRRFMACKYGVHASPFTLAKSHFSQQRRRLFHKGRAGRPGPEWPCLYRGQGLAKSSYAPAYQGLGEWSFRAVRRQR